MIYTRIQHRWWMDPFRKRELFSATLQEKWWWPSEDWWARWWYDFGPPWFFWLRVGISTVAAVVVWKVQHS